MATVWIGTGGTGGHIYPAVAVAKQFSQQGWDVQWIGCRDSMEASTCHKENIEFFSLNQLKWQGYVSALLWVYHLINAFFQTYKLSLSKKPDAILVMGGYVSLTTGLVAAIRGIPLFLHEQNSVLGRANRLLYRFITKGFCAYPSIAKRWPKLSFVGNPYTVSPRDKTKKWSSKKLKIVSLGGSGGAKAINELMSVVMIDPKLAHCQFWHLAGNQGRALLALNDERIKVEQYNHQIEQVYEWADIVIARSGAMTLTELAVFGLPAFLLPYPFAKDDHQKINAMYYIENGAALWCPKTPHELADALVLLSEDEKKFNKMSQCMSQLAPQACPQKLLTKVMVETINGL